MRGRGGKGSRGSRRGRSGRRKGVPNSKPPPKVTVTSKQGIPLGAPRKRPIDEDDEEENEEEESNDENGYYL
ncbi:unnamed protein product [Rhizopus stolonifer]